MFYLENSKIEGIVIDKGPLEIPVLAGSSEQFYPEFDIFDPWPLNRRGYYFNGNSLMQLPPYLDKTGPLLTFGN